MFMMSSHSGPTSLVRSGVRLANRITTIIRLPRRAARKSVSAAPVHLVDMSFCLLVCLGFSELAEAHSYLSKLPVVHVPDFYAAAECARASTVDASLFSIGSIWLSSTGRQHV